MVLNPLVFSLNLDCPPESMDGGVEPALLTFTPTRDMPDTLYYQVSQWILQTITQSY